MHLRREKLMQTDDPDFIDTDLEDKELEEINEGEEFQEKREAYSLESISVADIPIKISLEVTRFEVTLNELSQMGPGYKLPIEINPRIVHLTVSGKTIGKGEMIEIGDTIGVKILELY
jgi:flagellar motor switch/type III secretory pathway protein FliN